MKRSHFHIIDNVDEEDKVQLQNERVTASDPSKFHPHSILINESGLYSLMLRSNKNKIEFFNKTIIKNL